MKVLAVHIGGAHVRSGPTAGPTTTSPSATPGNAALLKALPPTCRLGDNANAFLGGFRAWDAPAALQPAGRRVAPSAAAASRKTKGA